MLGSTKSILKAEKNILFAYVYGSFGRGEKDFHDIDIAVFLKKMPKNSVNYEANLKRKLEKKSKFPVDVRLINSAPLLLKSRMIKEGKIIFSRNPKIRINFEAETMSEYLDFSYLMKEFDKRRIERYAA